MDQYLQLADDSPEGLLRRAIDANTAAEAQLVTAGPAAAGVWADIGFVWTRCADVAMTIEERGKEDPWPKDVEITPEEMNPLLPDEWMNLVACMLRVMPSRMFTVVEESLHNGLDVTVVRSPDGSVTVRV